MRRTNAKIVGGVLVLAVILVAVAYAAITSTQLNINGTGNATANQSNFKVEFIGTPTTGGKGTTTATIDSSVKTNGTVTVNGLTAKGDEATATYTVKNLSADLSADLSAEATSSNEEYFEVLCTLEKTTLKAQEETTLKVTVRLLKTPIDETKENLKTDIGVTVTAEPKQPGEENNGGSQTVSSATTTGGTYLPKGFRQVSGTTLEKGLTIQDSTGNQYVWVEVPKTKEVYPTAGLEITEFTESEYTAIETDLHTYTNDYRNGTSFKDEYYSDAVTGLTREQYTQLKQKMLKSVYQNGGFYIGKYETGTETARTSGDASTAPTDTPVIKPNAYPYNYVTCSQAQTLATTKMESGDRTTSLLFGVQWDLTLKYLETKGTSQADLKTNSTSWGNYGNNAWSITNANLKYSSNYGKSWTTATEKSKTSDEVILLSTGADDSFSKMKIYDLAGNVGEWTLEYTSITHRPCAFRGGSYNIQGSVSPASDRGNYVTNIAGSSSGFRCVLY